jgi:hypothetical protein
VCVGLWATTKAVLLPDGKVLIGHGVNRSANCNVDGRPCTYEEKEGLHSRMIDPATGRITRLASTTVSRGRHGTATLLPDATAFFAGENREALVRPDDPSFPLMSSSGHRESDRNSVGERGSTGDHENTSCLREVPYA